MEKRLAPAIILLLTACLVAVIGLWAMDRAGAGGATAAGAGTAASAGEAIQWKLVQTWPKNLPGLGAGPEYFAREVNKLSNGRLQVRVYGAGEIVPAFEVFDAVSGGVAQMGHGAAYYWKGKMPASVFFATVPFGLTAKEINGWLHFGGGLELWREVYAPSGVLPLAGGNSGTQMAGWFNREINSLEDIKGLKMRIPGLAGEVFSAIGGTSVRIPGGEIYTSMQTGVIDATEWVGPYNDLALGLHEVAEYYYYPGWHEPGPTLEFIVNQEAFEALPADLQAIVTTAARAANENMLDEFTARNNAALRELIDEHGVQLRKLPDDVLQALADENARVMQELVTTDPMAKKVYASYKAYRDNVMAYHSIAEHAFLNARAMTERVSASGK